jgi:hypothetical protein
MLEAPGSGGTVDMRRTLRQQCGTNSPLGGFLLDCEMAKSPNLRMNSILERREQLGGLKSGHKQCKHSYRLRDNVKSVFWSTLKSSAFLLSFCPALHLQILLQAHRRSCDVLAFGQT